MIITYPDDDLRFPGVYAFQNTLNENIYVGSTVNSLRQRFHQHISLLRQGTHHNLHLQRAFNKDGEECFDFYPLECVIWQPENKQELQDYVHLREFYYFTALRPEYNIEKIPGGGATGLVISQQTRDKISKANKGRKKTKEHKERISAANRKTWFLMSPEGEILVVDDMSALMRQCGFTNSSLRAVANACRYKMKGKYYRRWSYKGWTRPHCVLKQSQVKD